MSQKTNRFYEFGPFRMDPSRQLLLRDGQPVPLTPKAFETLLVLVQRGEELVSKDELMKLLWPDTFVEESNLTQHISMLRKALGESPQDHRYIVTMSGRGYRFAQKAREVSDTSSVIVQSYSVQRLTVEETESREKIAVVASAASFKISRNWILGTAAVLALLVLMPVWVVRMRRPPPLNEADLVLVSDFVNTTGEPVFDGTLKLALTEKLAESPFFNIVPDSVTGKTLGLMGRSAGGPVLPPVAGEVCQRENAKAVVGGSILNLGSKYVLNLDATNCLTGASVAHQEIEALNRDQVLSKLGQASPSLRRKLGESVGSIQRFDTPIEQATTKSLAALKAFTSGDQKRAQGGETDSVPFYKMAIELDPDFAIAYARLGTVYGNLKQPDLADEYLQQAFQRREHVSEREKFDIQAHYYEDTT
ncbi:MAG TPA: winged helix-turn-helix domain-containing protein [Terriglobales bacterium]|nr:winged helix-turn-helix domain-containing protein [Terriglobales bacterium]